jgi:hypothetical protein
MTSQINPNNIDGNYPVAGVPNNTQGMRDNFTNTRTNFQFAADEITELQNTAVLKAALTGTTLDNNMNDNLLYAARIQDFSASIVQITATSGSITVDYAAGHYQTISTTGSVSLNFTNFPAAGSLGLLRLQITVNSTAHTVTLPAAVGTGASATSARDIVGMTSNVISFAATGTYVFDFWSTDGGSAIFVEDLTRTAYTGSEDLAPSAAASLSRSVSYFTTAGAETATLAAGVEGQVKTFAAQDVTAGNMVITITNAGWQASGTGTITFGARGDACTLQYINSRWFCIGNNGCVFG